MKVAVIGLGSWGTAAAGLVSLHADEVTGWAHSEAVASGIEHEHRNPRYLTGYVLPDNVHATTNLSACIKDADAALVAVPSSHLVHVSSELASVISSEIPLLVLTKGMDEATGRLMTEAVGDAVGHPERIACLSGPNHAEEICLGKVSAAVIASANPDCAAFFQKLMVSPNFRAYVSDDLVGVEVCGAVKNVIAIACGCAVGLDAGDNTLAVLMTRGLAEISRIVAALGGNPLTCMGLAGMGDLVATCTSEHSRNRTFGEGFVAGESLEAYEARTHMVVEGARAAKSVWKLCCEKGIEAPITGAVHAILYEGTPVDAAIATLLGRSPRVEFYGL